MAAPTMPQYAFLAHPPPKHMPDLPLPSLPPPSPAAGVAGRPKPRHRSATSIKTWAREVQPGSPAPCSPRRRPSVSSPRRATSIRRRPSVGHAEAPPNSFLHIIDTPSTASPKSFEVDLTKYGYNSVFVNVPTPITPSPFIQPISADDMQVDSSVPASPTAPKRRGLRKLKSLANIGSRLRSKSPAVPSSPKKMKQTADRKQNSDKPLPPSLESELLLMQFVGGGHLDTYAQRVMKNQAKQSANHGSSATAGVGAVFRDEKGKIWWDKDEQQEYACLLGADSPSCDWVSFNGDLRNSTTMARKNSVSTVNTDLGAPLMRNADDSLVLGVSVASVPLRGYWTNQQPSDLMAFKTAGSTMLTVNGGEQARIRRRGKLAAKNRPPPLRLHLAKPPSIAKPFNGGLATSDFGRQSFLEHSFVPVCA